MITELGYITSTFMIPEGASYRFRDRTTAAPSDEDFQHTISSIHRYNFL